MKPRKSTREESVLRENLAKKEETSDLRDDRTNRIKLGEKERLR